MRRNHVAIVGAAETTELGVIPNVSQIQLHADAALNAIADGVKEKAETAVMTLQPGSGYNFGGTGGKKSKKVKAPSATVTLLD